MENVQNSKDDCEEYPVKVEKLTELRNLCRKVTRCKSKESMAKLLPTQSGFFFGTTDYEEYYIKTCKETAKMLTSLLKELEEDKKNGLFPTIYYQSSW